VFIHPNIKWYDSTSQEKALLPRCPFAAVSRCPRYYESLSLLGDSGIATKVAGDAELLATWSKSELWPRVREQASSISGAEGNPSAFANFCPEVAFNVFGLFASYLSRYADEIDKNFAHQALVASGFSGVEDWRWAWQHVEPMHYSQCPLYSLLLHKLVTEAAKESKAELVQLRPTFYGISVDLKGLWAKFNSWRKKGKQ